MRPIELTISAFGPYAEKQIFDFTKLNCKSFFLIHGPTGSGKSTVLDAICFALYGESSGKERDGKMMRSDHADISTPTEVSFSFSLKDKKYSITRVPEQEMVKKRGTGTRMTTNRAELTCWEDGQYCLQPEYVVSGWSKVTEQVETLIGFKSDQFRQVMMLPQGQFRRLLVSDSRDRQKIMEKLFRTEVYSRIESALKEVFRKVELEANQLHAKQAAILEQADSENFAEMETERKNSTELLGETQTQLSTLQKKEKEAQEKFTLARDNNRKIEEAGQAAESLEDLLKQKPQTEVRKSKLEKARLALPLVEIDRAREQRLKEFRDAEKQLINAQSRLTGAEEASQRSKDILKTERGRDGERERARLELEQLKRLVGRVRLLEEGRKELDDLTKNENALSDKLKKLKDGLESIDQKVEFKTRELDQTKAVAAKADSLKLTLDALNKQIDQYERIQSTERKLEFQKTELGGAQSELEKFAVAHKAALKKYEVMESRWLQGQSAVLAKELIENQPCPVCGSPDHPAPAKAAEDLPTEEGLKRAKNKVKKQENLFSQQRESAAMQEKLVTKLQSEIDSLRSNFGEASAENDGDWAAEKKELEQRYRESFEAIGRLTELTAEIEGLRANRKRTIMEHETTGQTQLNSLAKLKTQEGVVNDRRANIPEDLRDLKILAARIKLCESTVNSMNKALEKAEQNVQTALRELAGAEQAFTGAGEKAEQARVLSETALAEFQDKLIRSGFADDAAFRDAIMDEIDITVLDEEIAAFDGSLKAAGIRSEKAGQEAEGVRWSDLHLLTQEWDDIKSQLSQSEKETGRLSGQIKQLETWLKNLAEVSKDLMLKEELYSIVGDMAEVAGGRGRNAYGMTFQSYVLSTLLDEVLIAATQRLRLMTRGRFQLYRSRDRNDRRRLAGLDIFVYDINTGTERPVTSLSGGETFLASLSLALGLTDVVQAYSGGIQLDTLFIDEGFGSLDPESLDLAFRALKDLQAGGRLIGIISHVPELRELIDARLEVTPGRKGSSARFHV